MENEGSVGSAGSAPALIEFFSIEGLYGYRSVSLSAAYAATILIAKNGAGKTTLLGALDAFLRCQFGRLSHLKFDKIVCKLRGWDSVLELTSSDVEALMSVAENEELLAASRRYGVEPSHLVSFIEGEFEASRDYYEYEEDEVFKRILVKHGYAFQEAKRACVRISDAIHSRVPAIKEVSAAIRAVLVNVEVVYLPTYRRIELSLGEEVEDGRYKRRRSIQSRLGLPKRTLFKTDIQFGLSDISDRLRELNIKLLGRSNQGYRQISAKIINDLIDGTFERESALDRSLPNKESLTLFFSRLKHGGRHLHGRYFDQVDVPDIDAVYDRGASSDVSDKFLNYFLSRLNSVIQATRDIEGLVEQFIDHCNAYLAGRDRSTEFLGNSASSARDDKRLEIDRLTLQVNVVSAASGRKIPMDSLSSGEKQMISLFARLYLYPGEKVVLIDEPELSLSIEWQRKVLVDVVDSPSCKQVIAITHSPYVFDNELEPYARGLMLRVDTSAIEEFQDPPDLFLDEVSDE